MSEQEKIRESVEIAKKLLRLGQEIQDSTGALNNYISTMEWVEKAYVAMPTQSSQIYSGFNSTVDGYLQLSTDEFTKSFATGSTANVITTAITDTRQIIMTAGNQYRYLLTEFYQINPTKKRLEEVLNQLRTINEELYNLFEIASNTYEQWESGLRDNSDLCKDIRTFQDIFHGWLHKLRLKSDGAPKNKDTSWQKMSESIYKSGSGNLSSLKKQEFFHDDCHNKFTVVMKRTHQMSKSEMEATFSDYVNHVYSVINLIDESLLTP
jgi:hypothetical protein